MPSRAEYLAYIESTQQPRLTRDLAADIVRTAAVSFEHLTNNPEWDRFLSIVQERYEVAKKEREHQLSLCGGAVGDALESARLVYQFLDGRVKAFEEVLGLPHQVMEAYQSVKK